MGFVELRCNIRTPIFMEGQGTDSTVVAPLANWRNDFLKKFQYYLNLSTPHPLQMWLGTLAVAMVYFLRVYHVQGFYVVSYGLGIYVLILESLNLVFVAKGRPRARSLGWGFFANERF